MKKSGWEKIQDRHAIAQENALLLREALPYITVGRPVAEMERIEQCCTWWSWDVYHPHRMMVVDRVNRCRSRLCPCCLHMRSVELYNKHKAALTDTIGRAYHVTLTVPNVSATELHAAVAKLCESFRDLWRHHAKLEIGTMAGALRSVEISYNKDLKNWHPHLHCLVVMDEPIPGGDLVQTLDTGIYDYVRRKRVMISPVEYTLGRRWAAMMGNPGEAYFVRVRTVEDENGLWEVVKYPAKFDSFDTLTGSDFAAYYEAVYRRRLRQGYGCLYGVAADEEEPEETLTRKEVIDMLGYEPEGTQISIDDDMSDFEGYKRYRSYAAVQISNLNECVPAERPPRKPGKYRVHRGSRTVNITVNM